MKNTRFFAALRMTTLLVCSLLFVVCSYSQSVITNPDGSKVVQDENGGWKFVDPSPVKYRYYFMFTVVQDKEKIVVYPEPGTESTDIPDSVFMIQKGGKYSNRLYKTYSEIFTYLSAAGLEFVQMATMPTGWMNRDSKEYSLWRKRVN